ncbi:hypothetical protein ZWY2020_002650, partial [Hordeum vulgare]
GYLTAPSPLPPIILSTPSPDASLEPAHHDAVRLPEIAVTSEPSPSPLTVVGPPRPSPRASLPPLLLQDDFEIITVCKDHPSPLGASTNPNKKIKTDARTHDSNGQNWCQFVAEKYRLVPHTLYLTVNYIDRYLSVNEINRQTLELLGIACMLIAAKYEEICAPQVEVILHQIVLNKEASVLNYLKFEMTAPTAKCFLRRFVRAAQVCDEDPPLHLEFLANYVVELSLLEYSLLAYPPSLVAASSIFLMKFILQPAKHPWISAAFTDLRNSTLAHYTQYKPSELCDCVKALHRLSVLVLGVIFLQSEKSTYKFVGKKQCPTSVPAEFFRDTAC